MKSLSGKNRVTVEWIATTSAPARLRNTVATSPTMSPAPSIVRRGGPPPPPLPTTATSPDATRLKTWRPFVLLDEPLFCLENASLEAFEKSRAVGVGHGHEGACAAQLCRSFDRTT